MPTIQQLISAIDAVFPLSRAESWDKTGLQIGDGAAEVRRAVIAHEVTSATLEAARGAGALVVYHPLIFRPLETLDFQNHTARLAGACVAQGLNVIAVHTALDNAPPLAVKPPGALGDALARELGLRGVNVLSAAGREALCKIVVFTPPEALEKVSEAMWQTGAGEIGFYDEASFRTRGTGTFRPLPGAEPYSGTMGVREEADEWRLEVIAPEARRESVVAAMMKAHPYEEVAYDVYALKNAIHPYGAARVGTIDKPLPLEEFAAQVQSRLQAPNVRIVRGAKDAISRVACSPGSGASFIDAAVRAGCDALVTGDIKHHDALKAQALGLTVIDATHTATERGAVPLMADVLRGLPGLQVDVCELDTNPFGS
jgi:dinuclear metal center YbgI/SA1388 family protein